MNRPKDYREIGCQQCVNGAELGFDFSMAFQPIVDIDKKHVYAQEALARGLNGEPAGSVFEHVNDDNLYRFDQTCRVKAIKLAAHLGISSLLSINFMPRAVYKPELCIRTTLAAAESFGFPKERIIFECTESEQVDDLSHLLGIFHYYQMQGFKTAIDDFGAGYSGLNLLADFVPDIIKLDMALIRHVDKDHKRQSIVKGVMQICDDLGIDVIAEGTETREEVKALVDQGVKLFQGFYFAKPAFEAQAIVDTHRYALA